MSISTDRPRTRFLGSIAARPWSYSTIAIEPLAPGDTMTVQAVFDGLGAESRFLRFHTGLPRLTPRMLNHLAAVRDAEHMVFVARVNDRAVGLVRWIRLSAEPTVADLAMEVVDDFQGRGIGTSLLVVAAQSARRAGILEFHADVAPGHHRLRGWFSQRGIYAASGTSTRFRLPISPMTPGSQAIRRQGRR